MTQAYPKVIVHADTVDVPAGASYAFTRGWVGEGLRAFTVLPEDMTLEVADAITEDGHADVLVDIRAVYVYGVN